MFRKLILLITILTAAAYVGWHFSPWPSALFYRYLMNQGGLSAHAALAKHVPGGVVEVRDQTYDANNPAARFDLFRPAGQNGKPLPVIVWVHGGGFLSGSKDQIANYLKILAARGFVTVGIDYALAPGAKYPQPVREAATALGHIFQNAKHLGIDPARILLAGDSAGAQIAAQLALVISQPEYAERTGLNSPIPRDALRGVILHCGFHDPDSIRADGAAAGFVKAVTWSYFGVASIEDDPRAKEFSIVANVAAGFPPMFISAGNADPLGPQSRKLAEVAAKAGLTVDSLFFPLDHTPPLAHEYQFNLDLEAGKLALERVVAFAAERTK